MKEEGEGRRMTSERNKKRTMIILIIELIRQTMTVKKRKPIQVQKNPTEKLSEVVQHQGCPVLCPSQLPAHSIVVKIKGTPKLMR
jgi:hypothetical protein